MAGTAAALTLLGWIAWDAANPPVRWNDIAFDVSRADVTVVTFETIMEPGATATCRVRALDAGYAEVGVSQVPVGPSGERVIRMRTTLRTTGQAVTGGVAECTPSSP